MPGALWAPLRGVSRTGGAGGVSVLGGRCETGQRARVTEARVTQGAGTLTPMQRCSSTTAHAQAQAQAQKRDKALEQYEWKVTCTTVL